MSTPRRNLNALCMVPAMTTEVNAADMLADLAALGNGKQWNKCSAALALDSLDPQLRDAVESILWNRPDVTASDLVDVLARHGVEVDVQSLRRHRRTRGGCKCPKQVVA